MKLKIAQLLCPARHAVVASMYDPSTSSDFDVEQTMRSSFEGMIRANQMNPWCGICGSPRSTWFFEANDSVFDVEDLEMARQVVADLEQAQRIARRHLDSIGVTFDSRSRRAARHEAFKN